MNKLFKASMAATAAALMTVTTFALPASATADLTLGNGLGMTVDITEVGSGSSRTMTWTVTVSDSQGRTFVSGAPAAGEIQFVGSSTRLCTTNPPAFERTNDHTSGCNSMFSTLLGDQLGTTTFNGSTFTAVISTSVASTTQDVANYDTTRLTKTFAATVAYLRFNGTNDQYSLYSTAGAASRPVSSDMDPGVAFSGFLIGGATGRTVTEDTAGTLRLTGKRLHLVHSATIGGIEVTVTSATRSAVELDFDALPAGKHDVVLKTKAGSATTLRGFVTVN